MANVNPLATAMPIMAQQSLPATALASPYDGTTPQMGAPIMGPTMGAAPQLTGLGSGTGGPQVNATNQTALAPNGDVNQSVTNSNQYTNKYYNIIVPSAYGGIGGYGGIGAGLGAGLGSWNQPGNSFIDPKTGVLYVQQETGVVGWFKRLFRGY